MGDVFGFQAAKLLANFFRAERRPGLSKSVPAFPRLSGFPALRRLELVESASAAEGVGDDPFVESNDARV
jgi:hypothetical protein